MNIFKNITLGFIALSAILSSSNLKADETSFKDDSRFVLGIGAVIPFGKYSDNLSSIGGGLNLRAEVPIFEKHAALTGVIGLDYFGGRSAGNNYIGYRDALTMTYLQGGLKIYLSNLLYIQGEIGGAGTYRSRTTYFVDGNNNTYTSTATNKVLGGYIFSLGVGVILPVGSKGLDLSVKYHGTQLGEGSDNYLNFASVRIGIPLF